MAYRGSVIRLPIGMQGFNGSRNPSQLQPGHLSAVEGISLDGGLIQKEGGASKLNSVAIGDPSIVVSGISYSPTVDAWREVVFLDNGKILKDDGTGLFATTLATSLIDVRLPPPYFLPAGGESTGSPRTLFMFSATNQVRFMDGDGTSMAAISTPAADWAGAGNFPTFGVVHENRVFAGGNASDPHRLYYSYLTDHTNFSGASAGSLSIFPGKGERLCGAVSFKGLLVVFKYPRGIYFVTTTDPSPAAWRVDTLTTAVGSVNQHCIVPIDNDTLYMDAVGNFHLLSATNAFGGVQTSNISQIADIADYMRSNLDTAEIKRSTGIWYGEKQQAIFALPIVDTIIEPNGPDNRLKMTIDFSNPQIGIRFLPSRRDTAVSLWRRRNSDGTFKPAHGDNEGFVWLMDQEARNKGGAAYTASFETANMDLSFVNPILATKDKSGDFLEIAFENQGDWELAVTIYWDGVPSPTLLYRMGGNGSGLGSFTLDTDVLGSDGVSSIRKRIVGSGRRIKIKCENTGVDENIALSDFYLSFRVNDERQR